MQCLSLPTVFRICVSHFSAGWVRGKKSRSVTFGGDLRKLTVIVYNVLNAARSVYSRSESIHHDICDEANPLSVILTRASTPRLEKGARMKFR